MAFENLSLGIFLGEIWMGFLVLGFTPSLAGRVRDSKTPKPGIDTFLFSLRPFLMDWRVALRALVETSLLKPEVFEREEIRSA